MNYTDLNYQENYQEDQKQLTPEQIYINSVINQPLSAFLTKESAEIFQKLIQEAEEKNLDAYSMNAFKRLFKSNIIKRLKENNFKVSEKDQQKLANHAYQEFLKINLKKEELTEKTQDTLINIIDKGFNYTELKNNKRFEDLLNLRKKILSADPGVMKSRLNFNIVKFENLNLLIIKDSIEELIKILEKQKSELKNIRIKFNKINKEDLTISEKFDKFLKENKDSSFSEEELRDKFEQYTLELDNLKLSGQKEIPEENNKEKEILNNKSKQLNTVIYNMNSFDKNKEKDKLKEKEPVNSAIENLKYENLMLRKALLSSIDNQEDKKTLNKFVNIGINHTFQYKEKQSKSNLIGFYLNSNPYLASGTSKKETINFIDLNSSEFLKKREEALRFKNESYKDSSKNNLKDKVIGEIEDKIIKLEQFLKSKDSETSKKIGSSLEDLRKDLKNKKESILNQKDKIIEDLKYMQSQLNFDPKKREEAKMKKVSKKIASGSLTAKKSAALLNSIYAYNANPDNSKIVFGLNKVLDTGVNLSNRLVKWSYDDYKKSLKGDTSFNLSINFLKEEIRSYYPSALKKEFEEKKQEKIKIASKRYEVVYSGLSTALKGYSLRELLEPSLLKLSNKKIPESIENRDQLKENFNKSYFKALVKATKSAGKKEEKLQAFEIILTNYFKVSNIEEIKIIRDYLNRNEKGEININDNINIPIANQLNLVKLDNVLKESNLLKDISVSDVCGAYIKYRENQFDIKNDNKVRDKETVDLLNKRNLSLNEFNKLSSEEKQQYILNLKRELYSIYYKMGPNGLSEKLKNIFLYPSDLKQLLFIKLKEEESEVFEDDLKNDNSFQEVLNSNLFDIIKKENLIEILLKNNPELFSSKAIDYIYSSNEDRLDFAKKVLYELDRQDLNTNEIDFYIKDLEKQLNYKHNKNEKYKELKNNLSIFIENGGESFEVFLKENNIEDIDISDFHIYLKDSFNVKEFSIVNIYILKNQISNISDKEVDILLKDIENDLNGGFLLTESIKNRLNKYDDFAINSIINKLIDKKDKTKIEEAILSYAEINRDFSYTNSTELKEVFKKRTNIVLKDLKSGNKESLYSYFENLDQSEMTIEHKFESIKELIDILDNNKEVYINKNVAKAVLENIKNFELYLNFSNDKEIKDLSFKLNKVLSFYENYEEAIKEYDKNKTIEVLKNEKKELDNSLLEEDKIKLRELLNKAKKENDTEKIITFYLSLKGFISIEDIDRAENVAIKSDNQEDFKMAKDLRKITSEYIKSGLLIKNSDKFEFKDKNSRIKCLQEVKEEVKQETKQETKQERDFSKEVISKIKSELKNFKPGNMKNISKKNSLSDKDNFLINVNEITESNIKEMLKYSVSENEMTKEEANKYYSSIKQRINDLVNIGILKENYIGSYSFESQDTKKILSNMKGLSFNELLNIFSKQFIKENSKQEETTKKKKKKSIKKQQNSVKQIQKPI